MYCPVEFCPWRSIKHLICPWFQGKFHPDKRKSGLVSFCEFGLNHLSWPFVSPETSFPQILNKISAPRNSSCLYILEKRSHSIRTYHVQLSINPNFRTRIAESMWDSCEVSPILTEVKSDSKVIGTLTIEHSHILFLRLRSSTLFLATGSCFCIWQEGLTSVTKCHFWSTVKILALHCMTSIFPE